MRSIRIAAALTPAMLVSLPAMAQKGGPLVVHVTITPAPSHTVTR